MVQVQAGRRIVRGRAEGCLSLTDADAIFFLGIFWGWSVWRGGFLVSGRVVELGDKRPAAQGKDHASSIFRRFL
jgi:hypothetical protein